MKDNNIDEMESPIPQEVIDAFKEDMKEIDPINELNIMNADELLADIRKTDPTYNPPQLSNILNMHSHQIDVGKMNPITMEILNNYQINPPEYVFHPCLETQGICFIYAAAGLGKTLFALNLAYAIAGGGEFLKYICPKPRKVLYIDGEMKFSQLAARIALIKSSHGVLDFPENFGVLTPDELQKHGIRMPKVDTLYGQDVYNQIIDKFGYEVIVIDNLSVLTTLDENKSHEWMIVIDWLLFLRAKGKSIIVVHHAGKDKNGYRGSSRLLDCADTAISLQPVNDDNVEDVYAEGKKFKIVYQKSRSFGGKDAVSYEVTLEQQMFSYRSIEQSVLDKVVECLNAKMSQREIARELLISQPTVNRLIKKARIAGRVRDY